MKIIFDFDHTLYSTSKLYFTAQEVFKEIGVSEELFRKSFQESKRKGKTYNPDEQIRLIVERKPELSSDDIKEKIKEVLNNSSVFLYPEVVSFLEKFKNELDLYILSYGGDDGDFQKEKIKRTKIEKYFNEIHITNEIGKISTLETILDDTNKIILVDDSPEVLFKAKKFSHEIITIRINRGEGKYKNYPDNSNIDFSINNFKELEKIVLTEL